MTPALPQPDRLASRTAVVDLSPVLVREISKLFSRDSIILEAEN